MPSIIVVIQKRRKLATKSIWHIDQPSLLYQPCLSLHYIWPVKHPSIIIYYIYKWYIKVLPKLRILESKNKLPLVHKPPLLHPPLFDVCAWNDEEEWVVDEKLAMSFELSNWMKDYAYDLKATYLISYSWKNAPSKV